MTDRSWTLDERLHAFRLDDFTTEERALAWKIAECYPAFCRLNPHGSLIFGPVPNIAL
jgi:hypothetical protein